MKTLSYTLIVIFFNLVASAQTVSRGIINNMKYINEVKSTTESIKIGKMQNIAADYDIKDSDVYQNKKHLTYDVIFKETNANIKARFNSDGEILNSIEVYTDMRLPLSLSKIITKQYKNWAIVNNTQLINYDYKKGCRNEYVLTIKKGDQLKILKLKADNTKNNTETFVALRD